MAGSYGVEDMEDLLAEDLKRQVESLAEDYREIAAGLSGG